MRGICVGEGRRRGRNEGGGFRRKGGVGRGKGGGGREK